MFLLRENIEKQRAVYRLNDRIRKVWSIDKLNWVRDHVDLLNKEIPGYVIDTNYNDKNVWIDYKIIPGISANTFEHTQDFIDRIYNFCLNNIKETSPYVHGDWSLSNMIIDGESITMCDWDNLGIYPEDQVYKKLHQDLFDSFGVSFNKLIEQDVSNRLAGNRPPMLII